MFNAFELTGRARSHVSQYLAPRFAAHPQAGAAFLAMREAALADGFDLSPFSTYRDYATQLRIWNNKFSGKKPLYDMAGQVRDTRAFTPDQIIDCILNWSALPGGSRHQWGTEIDVVDAAVMPPGYAPRLLPEEVAPGGLFHPMHCWLDQNMDRFGFFRPYRFYKGGMYPEPWHLSYAPVASVALGLVTPDLLRRVTREADILGKELILPRIEQIYEQHVMNIVAPGEREAA
ncbi:MAG TPA: M15 family metallopeptidase [Telluria sp.]|jgi:LAS superfamily LD-carboxypeptidase LdcB